MHHHRHGVLEPRLEEAFLVDVSWDTSGHGMQH